MGFVDDDDISPVNMQLRAFIGGNVSLAARCISIPSVTEEKQTQNFLLWLAHWVQITFPFKHLPGSDYNAQ